MSVTVESVQNFEEPQLAVVYYDRADDSGAGSIHSAQFYDSALLYQYSLGLGKIKIKWMI